MRIALAQLDPIVGDVAGNTALVVDAVERARRDGADVLVAPELALVGYPPRDLLLRSGVVEACERAVAAIAARAGGLTVVVGHPRRDPDGVRGLRNSVSVCRDGEVRAVYDKRLLPGYDIFDEDRYFDPGGHAGIVEVPVAGGGGATTRLGLLICEDLWQAGDVTADPRYAIDPLRDLAAAGCDAVACPSASPFILGKFPRRLEVLSAAARRHGVTLAAVNQVGANDDLIYDGRSILVDDAGVVRAILPGWEPAVTTVDLAATGAAAPDAAAPEAMEDLFRALVLGVRDYCRKTGHDRVLVGVSGGIDSAVTAAIATAAVGPANVAPVWMPSRYSSEASRDDALSLSERLGLPRPDELSIEAGHEALRQTVAPAFPHGAEGLTDENIQARLRGVILMACANATGALVLATGNKSELAVGYATLYGDMCGAVAVLGDVVKTRVYELAAWINANPAAAGLARPPIPPRSITRPPSAELRPDQVDQDTLPPYEVLDEIVERHVEREQSAEEIVAATGLDDAIVGEVTAMIDRAEFKRNQAAVILKVTERAFGRGRPMPIVARPTSLDEQPAAVGDRREPRG